MAYRTLTARDYYLALLLAWLTLLFGAGYMTIGVAGVFHDDGIYLSTAKALAEGQGYRLINLPDSPLQTKYPPLYPAILAIIWKLFPTFPDNLVLMQFINLLSGAATVSLVYLYMVRFSYFSRGVAAGAAALTLTSVFYLYFCTITLSEILFALLAIVALWALDRQNENISVSAKTYFTLGVLLSLPALTRTIGSLFVPLGLFMLWRKGKPLRWTILAALALVGPWLLWILALPHWSGNLVSLYYTNYLTWGYASWKTALGRIFLSNIFYTGFATIAVGMSLFLAGTVIPLWTSPLPILFGIITWAMVVKDILKGGILPAFLFGYLIIVLVWPWPPIRFLIPLLPFLLAYFLSWTKTVLQWAPWSWPRWFMPVLLVMVLMVNLAFLGRATKVSHQWHYPVLVPGKKAVLWKSYQDIFQWIKDRTKPSDVIASGLDTMVFLYTGRQALRPFLGRPTSLFYGGQEPAVGSWEEILHFLKLYRARFLVQFPMPGFSEEKPFDAAIESLAANCPELLELVYNASDSRFRIYEICWSQGINCKQ